MPRTLKRLRLSTKRRGIFDDIINAIEAGVGEYRMPWHRALGSSSRPLNAVTRKPYRGVNTLLLWGSSERNGFQSGEWATPNQWKSRNGRIRSCERPTYALMRWPVRSTSPLANERKWRIRSYTLFNAEQVTHALGRTRKTSTFHDTQEPVLQDIIRRLRPLVRSSAFAFYDAKTDVIGMPPQASSDRWLSSASQSYCSTLFHELAHWTGASTRLARDLSGNFGSASYAMEELIAELGAAFLCADTGIASAPRLDHAQYIASWLPILQKDKRSLLLAACEAQRAADYVLTGGFDRAD
jgi:antirestriction protein ArdC